MIETSPNDDISSKPVSRLQFRVKLFPEQKEAVETAIRLCQSQTGYDRARALEAIALTFCAGGAKLKPIAKGTNQ